MVTFNSLQKDAIVVCNGTIADPYDLLFSHSTGLTTRQTTDRRHIVPKTRLNLTVSQSRGQQNYVDFYQS